MKYQTFRNRILTIQNPELVINIFEYISSNIVNG